MLNEIKTSYGGLPGTLILSLAIIVSSSHFLLFCTLCFNHLPHSLPRTSPVLHHSGLLSLLFSLPGPHSLLLFAWLACSHLSGLRSNLPPSPWDLPWPLYPKHWPSFSASQTPHHSTWRLARFIGRDFVSPMYWYVSAPRPMPGSQQEFNKYSRNHWWVEKEDWLSRGWTSLRVAAHRASLEEWPPAPKSLCHATQQDTVSFSAIFLPEHRSH